MKKYITILILLLTCFIIKGEEFDEYSFMKNVNPNITKRTMRIIKESVDKNFYMVKGVLSKKHVYMVMATESRFNQNATSPNGKDKGLLQVNIHTYNHLVKRKVIKNKYNKIYQIRYNVYIGILLLKSKSKTIKKKINYFDDKETLAMMVLIAYNKGVGGLMKDIEDGRYDFHNFRYIKHLSRFEKYI